MNPDQPQQLIIGTAGHVDHGKTALIRALTGVETDRLVEEKERGISIELGFAPLTLPDGRTAGVVDVPGHERFVPQMLAGVAGIDLVLLVVDANEGVMPQTREHLQIMELLELQRGILVLSKCDLVEPDWLDIVEEELREQVAGSFLAQAPCCRVSARTGEGLPQLLETILQQAAQLRPRDGSGAVRLPVDRCFSISGFGTVVTGTLVAGRVQCGDQLELLPSGAIGRVRELQMHGRTVESAAAGQRLAVNLAGVAKQQVPHGSVAGTPGLFRASTRIDVRLKLLSTAAKPLRFRDPVHLYLGTARAVGRVALLDRDDLQPGEECLAQIHLDRPLLAHRRDLFIIRSYSPMTTIGGGRVIDAQPVRHRRFRPEVLQRLEELQSGEQGFWLQKLDELECARLKDLQRQVGADRDQLRQGLQQLAAEGRVVQLAEQWLVTEKLRSWRQRLPEVVERYQQQHPLLHGMPRATLKGCLPKLLAPKGFEELLRQLLGTGELVLHGELVATADWQPQPDARQLQLIEQLEASYRQAGLQAKNRNEMLQNLDWSGSDSEPLFLYLQHEGRLCRLNQESYLHSDAYRTALQRLLEYFARHSQLTLAQYRDLLGSGRKLTQALLEHFDSLKYTRRTGDERVAWQLPEGPQSETFSGGFEA